MAKDTIDLERVRLRYDRRDGAIRLTSTDPRLRGKPFMLTLSRGSQAVDSLLDLFEAEGVISEDDILPETVDLDSIKDYRNGLQEQGLAGEEPLLRDSRLIFPVGMTYGSNVVAVDCGYAPFTLISGPRNTGKTEFLLALAQHAAASSISIHVLDPLSRGLDRSIPKLSRTSYGDGITGCHAQVGRILKELRLRLDNLRSSGEKSWVGYEARVGAMAPTFVFADALNSYGTGTWFSELARLGPMVGIHLFATLDSDSEPSADELEAFKQNFNRRILTGSAGTTETVSVFGKDPGISPRLLEPKGRAILKAGDRDPVVLQLVQGRSAAS